MRREVADYLARVFLDRFSDTANDITLEDAAHAARAQLIETGVGLRRGIADKALANVVEIGRSDGTGTATCSTCARHPARAAAAADGDLRLFLSQQGDDAAVAWEVDGTVRSTRAPPMAAGAPSAPSRSARRSATKRPSLWWRSGSPTGKRAPAAAASPTRDR